MRARRRRTGALAAALLGLAAAGGAAAQSWARATLAGTVLDDSTGAPLPKARVELLDGEGRYRGATTTDSAGRFLFRHVPIGAFRLRAARAGYEPATTPRWWLQPAEVLSVEVRLAPRTVLLAPLTVVASTRGRPSPVLEGFRARRAAGLGHFFTREDIARLGVQRLTDVLARVPGLALVGGGAGAHRAVQSSRALQARSCPTQIYVDGFLLNRALPDGRDPGFALDDAVPIGSVEGVEVYLGLAGVPAEFLNPEAVCGVVVVWTRRGDRSG